MSWPLDLDLLGLIIHLDQVVLDITAVPGAFGAWPLRADGQSHG